MIHTHECTAIARPGLYVTGSIRGETVTITVRSQRLGQIDRYRMSVATLEAGAGSLSAYVDAKAGYIDKTAIRP